MRLLSEVVIVEDVNDKLRIKSNAITASVLVAAGTYFMDTLQDAIATAIASHAEVTTAAVEVVGADIAADAARANGRVKFTTTGNGIQFLITDSAFSFDPRILGFDVDADEPSGGESSSFYSDDVHRFGWYPPAGVLAADDRETPASDRSVVFSDSHVAIVRKVRSYSEMMLKVRNVPAVFMRESALVARYSPATYGLSVGDLNASWATFWADVADGDTGLVAPYADVRGVRYFPDVSDDTDYTGRWIPSPLSALWSRPLSPPTREESTGGDAYTAFAELLIHPADA